MFTKKIALGIVILALSLPVLADDMVKNYIGSAEGVVKNGYGDCWRTTYSDTSEKKVECGYPAPVAEPVTETVVITEEVVTADTAASVTTTVNDMISISAAVLFGFDSAVLSDDGKAVIDERISVYKGRAKNTVEVTVIGHTDSTGPEAYNQLLSERRARAVADYLEENTNLPDDEIDAKGEGENSPVADNGSRDGRALNRRVVIQFEGVITK